MMERYGYEKKRISEGVIWIKRDDDSEYESD